MPIDQALADKLLKAGQITQETYNRALGLVTPKTTQLAGGAEMVRSPEEEQRLSQQQALLAKHRQDIAQSDIEAKQKAIDIQKADIERRRQLGLQAGLKPEMIEEKLAPEIKRITELEKPAGLQLTSYEKQPTIAPTPTLVTDLSGAKDKDTQLNQLFKLTTPGTAGYDLQQQAIAQGAVAGAAKAAETTAQFQQMQTDLAKMRKADESFRDEQSQKIADKQQELDNEISRVGSLSVDPNRFWASRDTGDKILIGIGLVLGAFGQGGSNRGVQAINRAIDRDINLQRSDIAQQERGIARKRGLLAEMRAKFKDDILAKNATKAAYLQDAQIKVQALASKYSGQEIQANAANLIGQLEVKKQEARLSFMKKYMKLLPVTAEVNPELLEPDQRERFVPGYGLALTKEAASKAREEIANYDSIDENLSNLIDLANTGSSVNPADRAQAEVIRTILVGQMRLPLLGPGTMQEFERDLINKVIANPTAIFSLDKLNLKRLGTLKERMNRQKINKLKTFGLNAPEEQIGFKPANQ